MRELFNDVPVIAAPVLEVPMLGKAEFVGHSSTRVERPSRMPTWTQDLPFRAKRLFATRMAKSDDQLRAAALAKVKQVVLFEPSDSALGLSLLEAGGGLVPADVLRSILEDTFVKKATNTVAKRATDFYKFAVWQVCENHARPLHPCEGDLYKYMCHMRDSGAAPTAPTSFLAAWRFMIYSVGVKLPNAPLTISARVEGVAYACRMTKRPLKQAPHLPVSAIKGLEELVFTGSVLQACLAGFMLFCMFCAARFGDAAKATGMSVDQSGRVFLMETAMFGCKTAAKAEEKRTLLPLISLGHLFNDEPWGARWMEARESMGLTEHEILMPAWDDTKERWLTRAMTSAEGGAWLQDLLVAAEVTPEEASKFTTHSLKSTPLTWAARSGQFTIPERRLMGHRVGRDESMVVTYSRDAMAPILGKLQGLIDRIRAGTFDPDEARSRRVRQIADDLADFDRDPKDWKNPQQSDEASDVSDKECEAQPIANIPGATHKGRNMQQAKFVQHRISSIVHQVLAADAWYCGRHLNANYHVIDFDPDDPGDCIVCEQCKKSNGP